MAPFTHNFPSSSLPLKVMLFTVSENDIIILRTKLMHDDDDDDDTKKAIHIFRM